MNKHRTNNICIEHVPDIGDAPHILSRVLQKFLFSKTLHFQICFIVQSHYCSFVIYIWWYGIALSWRIVLLLILKLKKIRYTSNNIYKDQLCYMLVYVVIIFSYALFMARIETWEALSKHLNRKWAYTDDRIMGNFHNIVNFLGPSRYYYIHSIYAKLSV